ncbi:MAG: RnfABCDGE type electron transport complex subunit B [Spirochaetota bacterium]
MDEMLVRSALAVGSLTGLGFLFGLILSVAKKKLHVEKDPRIESVENALPGANCGACGFPGCAAYAEKIVMDDADITLCPVGGGELVTMISDIMGKQGSAVRQMIARVHCQGGIHNTKNRFIYKGPHNCTAAQQVRGGFRVCSYGCLGLGECMTACPFHAITMSEERLPVVDPDKCTGCGKCVVACPRNIISLQPVECEVYVLCSNREKGPVMKQGCAVGCIGCKLCVVKACKLVFADNPDIDTAITVNNFLAQVNSDTCINCGRCGEVCPQNVISLPKKVKVTAHE